MNLKDYLLGVLCFLILILGFSYASQIHKTLSTSNDLILIDKQSTRISYIKVNVFGAVKRPGVVAINSYNPRVIDAIKAAGGLHKNANIDAITPAESIKNAIIVSIPFSFEEKVVIIKKEKQKLKKKKKKTKTKNKKKKKTKAKKKKKNKHKKKNNKKKKKKTKTIFILKPNSINPNTAPKELLMELPGIGEKLADKIIEYRNNSKFNSPEDLINVNGIGKKKLEKITPYLTF